MRVLIVKREKNKASFLRKALQAEGFLVDEIHDGTEALAAVAHTPFDAVIMDVVLPGLDGLSVVRQMRERKIPTPVLLLGARSGVSEKVAGLNAGSDDYLTTPFVLEELIARVRAICRRGPARRPGFLRVGDLTLDKTRRQVRRADVLLDLPPREFLVLEHLMQSVGRVCERTAIFRRVWDSECDANNNVVDVYIARLRKKIDTPNQPKLLHTIRGVGYMLGYPHAA